MAETSARSPKKQVHPVQAALGTMFALGSLAVLLDIAILFLFDLAARHFSLPSSRTVHIADPRTLEISVSVAVVLLAIGLWMSRGLTLESPGTYCGWAFGAVIAYAIWGGWAPGLGVYIYEGDWDRVRSLGVMYGVEAVWFLAVVICAFVWLTLSARRAHRRLAGLNHPSDGV